MLCSTQGGCGAPLSAATMDANPAQVQDLDYLLAANAAAAAPPADDAKKGEEGAASRKRPLGTEDKKARDWKRVQRNRELARVSNERRKGRIKAMENELEETRKTVSTLEDSIRNLENENNELRSLLGTDA